MTSASYETPTFASPSSVYDIRRSLGGSFSSAYDVSSRESRIFSGRSNTLFLSHHILLHVEDLHLLVHLRGDTHHTIVISPVGDLAIVVMIIQTFTGQMHGDQNVTTAAVHPQIVTTGLVQWNRASGIRVPAGSRLGKIEEPPRVHHLYGKNFAEISWQSECSSHQTPGSNHTSIDLADTKRLSICV
jgi:hypothetical protein